MWTILNTENATSRKNIYILGILSSSSLLNISFFLARFGLRTPRHSSYITRVKSMEIKRRKLLEGIALPNSHKTCCLYRTDNKAMILMAFNNLHKALTGEFVTIVTSTAKVVHHMTIVRRQKVQLSVLRSLCSFQSYFGRNDKIVYTDLATNFVASTD